MNIGAQILSMRPEFLSYGRSPSPSAKTEQNLRGEIISRTEAPGGDNILGPQAPGEEILPGAFIL